MQHKIQTPYGSHESSADWSVAQVQIEFALRKPLQSEQTKVNRPLMPLAVCPFKRNAQFSPQRAKKK
jgi:hypothetical protein